MQKFIIANRMERSRNLFCNDENDSVSKGRDVLNASCDKLVSLEEHVVCPPGINLNIFILLFLVHENWKKTKGTAPSPSPAPPRALSLSQDFFILWKDFCLSCVGLSLVTYALKPSGKILIKCHFSKEKSQWIAREKCVNRWWQINSFLRLS